MPGIDDPDRGLNHRVSSSTEGDQGTAIGTDGGDACPLRGVERGDEWLPRNR